jgi:outer membrane receptor protein involved in Fe transport
MKKTLTHFFTTLCFLIIGALTMTAQTRLLTGIVIDETTKTPLQGVTVATETGGTATDSLGRYELPLTTDNQTIMFSYLGYQAVKLRKDSLAKNATIFNLILAPESHTLDITVVTGSRYERKMTEETVTIEVLKPSFLQKQVVTSLSDAVGRAPGVQILDGQVNIRNGSGYAYGTGSRVLMLVDDMPLLSADLGDIKWNFMPVENAEQIEIIKGASSVMYGASALNGVIHLRTAQPTSTPYTSVSTYMGIYDAPKTPARRWWTNELKEHAVETGMYAAHRQKIGDNFDLTLGANIHYTRGYIKGCDERRARFNFNMRYRLPADPRWTIGLNGNAMQHGEAHFFLWKDGYTNNFVASNDPLSLDKYNTLTLDPYVQFADTSGLRHLLRGRYYYIRFLRGGGNLDMPVATMSAEYQFQKQFKKQKINLTAGLNYQNFTAYSTLFTTADTTDKVNGFKSGSSMAFFAQADKKMLHNKLNLTAGLRAERYVIDGYSTRILPVFRGGANYAFTKNDFLRGSWGQGYRFPSLAERFIDEQISGTPLRVLPNPTIRPERGWTAELAYKHTIANKNFRGYVDASVFLMEYKDMIEFNFDLHLPDGRNKDSVTIDDFSKYLGFKSKNVSDARIGGFEVSAFGEGKIGSKSLRLWTGYTYSFPGDLSSNSLQKRLDVYALNAFNAFAYGVDTAHLDQVLRYRNLHTVRFDVETDLSPKFTIGGSANYNSALLRLDDLFVGKGTWIELVEAVNGGPVVRGLTEFNAAHKNGDWVFDIRLGYNFDAHNKLTFNVNNVSNLEYALRLARMNAPRLFMLRYQRVF